MLHLADKRLHKGTRHVEFDFKGSSGPPTYRQRMDQKDTLKSIRAKMVSPLPSWSPLSHVVFESTLVSILEPVLRDEYSHIASSIATMYHPLDPRERALCGKTVDSHVSPVLPHPAIQMCAFLISFHGHDSAALVGLRFVENVYMGSGMLVLRIFASPICICCCHDLSP